MSLSKSAVFLALTIVLLTLAPGSHAQGPAVSVSLEADNITRLIPVQDIGVIKEGRSIVPWTASGNVTLTVNEMRITADSAVWHSSSTEIALNGGSVRIQLPGRASSVRIINKRGNKAPQ